jgi:ABC-2 type transport system ATP-binding protein
METVVKVNQLTKRFGSFIATNAISFEVKQGEIFGFLGANGAGKTTAMRMLSGLLSPSSGQATVAGFDIEKESEQVKRNIGYMSQKFSLYEDLTIQENIDFYGGLYGLSRQDIILQSKEIESKFHLESVMNKLVKTLPLGWKQKLAFSLALIHRPKVVFLDEPTGGVDPITRRQFWDLIYEAANQGVTIFITTHYMDEAEYCDRVSIMVDGLIKALDTPSELKKMFNVSSMDDVFQILARGTANKI